MDQRSRLIMTDFMERMAYRWNGVRCPELVAGSGKHIVVMVMSTDVHGNLPMMGHVTRRAAHPITPDDRWEEFVEVCGGPSEDRDEDTLEADLSILDHDRPFIFNFCSPAKSRT